jgi:dTDP-glucose pyrophosphorylase
LEYILDIVTLIGISEIRIVSDSSIKEIEHSIGDGSKWGTSISYTLAKPGDSL